MIKRLVHANPYLRLMRLHQPTGIWLLLWPGLWAIALAGGNWRHALLYTLGAVIMRGAGCIINDIADRKFDREVERTKDRPLASGELQVPQAAFFLCWLLIMAFYIALALGPHALLWGLFSLPLVAAYPFMKRITWWPQAFLGLTFNWGALLGWAAIRGEPELPALLLYAGGFFWTLGYDTIYGLQDIKDDALIGVRSTSRRLQLHTKKWITAFYTLAVLCWLCAAYHADAHPAFYAFLLAAKLHFGWQIHALRPADPASCARMFRSNRVPGGIVFLGCVTGVML